MTWVPCRLSHVLVEEHNDSQAIFLSEINGPRRLAIVIGAMEAAAINRAAKGESFARPLTHDLIVKLIEATGRRCTAVRIISFKDGTYFAELLLEDSSGVVTAIDCRPSDAIGVLARLNGVPLDIASEVFEATDG
ncbi:MAG: bifunctional nuclease family protein [Planctomycetota bacterium]|jgi:bifunctional DNase/RNase|nr:bifunctional nuclease family protein [Planctomycetota bacterium]